MSLLTDEQWDIVCYIERYFSKEQKFPSLSQIVEATHVDNVDVVDALNAPIVKIALDNRGINWELIKRHDLSNKQIVAIELLLNIADTRSISSKLKTIGVTSTTFSKWKNNEKFMGAYRQAARDLYGKSIPELHTAVIKRAIDGDAYMMKTALAISGEWDDKRSVEAMNIQFVLMKVLEVIQRHVQDPLVLNNIANEFDQVLNPGTKRAIE